MRGVVLAQDDFSSVGYRFDAELQNQLPEKKSVLWLVFQKENIIPVPLKEVAGKF